MDLLPDESQSEIIDQTSAYLDACMPLGRCRVEGPARARLDDAAWAEVAALGWFGLGLAEERGGIGFSLVEEVLVAREIGRRAGAIDLLATMLAVHVADAADDAPLRDAFVQGRTRVGWAECVDGDPSRLQVFDGESTPFWLWNAGEELKLIDPESSSSRIRRECIDEHVELLHAVVPAHSTRAAAPVTPDTYQHGAVLAAAYLTGLCEAARDQASAYACERVQFGKPIGVFQAIKHACADMAVRAEASWTQTCYAALALKGGLEDAPFQVSAAKALAGESATENAAANLQVHGGYGFTTEYDAHVLVKRTHVLNALAGSPRTHLRRVVDAPAAA